MNQGVGVTGIWILEGEMIMQPIARRPLQRRKHFQLLAEAPEPLSVDLCVETIQEAKKVFDALISSNLTPPSNCLRVRDTPKQFCSSNLARHCRTAVLSSIELDCMNAR